MYAISFGAGVDSDLPGDGEGYLRANGEGDGTGRWIAYDHSTMHDSYSSHHYIGEAYYHIGPWANGCHLSLVTMLLSAGATSLEISEVTALIGGGDESG